MSRYEIIINGSKFVVEVGDVSTSPVELLVNGERKVVEFREAPMASDPPTPAATPRPPASELQPKPVALAAPPVSVEGRAIVAPMPGKILSIPVKVGDAVSEGDIVCTLEAMKMEMPISSTEMGTVRAIHVNVGDTVAHDDPLVSLG